MAVEDAVLLARLLVQDGPVHGVLERWMGLRYERAMFVQRGSLETGLRMHDERVPPAERVGYVRTRLQGDVDRRYAVLGRDFCDEASVLTGSVA